MSRREPHQYPPASAWWGNSEIRDISGKQRKSENLDDLSYTTTDAQTYSFHRQVRRPSPPPTMTTRSPPRGIYVPVPTFFVPPSSPSYNPITPPLDLRTQSEHAIYLAARGIRGILLLGSSGEATMVSNAERRELIRHVRQELDKATFKSYPIMAGTATQGIEDTLEQLRISHEAGADWGMVLAPGYFAPVVTQEGLVDWYTAIADRSPMPIMMYDEPFPFPFPTSPPSYVALNKNP